MEHHFKIEDAIKYGIEKAVILYNIRFWLEKNKANGTNIKEFNGKSYYWTFNSARAFSELFPYMAERSISRYIKELEECGEIISSSFNKAKYDKTKWFTSNDYSISQNGESISQNDLTIPDNKLHIVNSDNKLIAPSENTSAEQKEKAEPKDELPDYLGKNKLTRFIKLYSLVWQDKFGNMPTAIPFGKTAGIMKPIFEAYSEMQIASLLQIHFSWHGTTGDDAFTYKLMSNRGFSLTDFRKNVDLYIAYLTNTMNVVYNDSVNVRRFVLKELGPIISKYKQVNNI